MKLKIILAFILFANLATGEKMIQIAVEIVEVNTIKAAQFGIKWPDILIIGERLGEDIFPTLCRLDEVKRSPLFANLRLLLDKGAAKIVANPRLVTKNNTTATFKVGGEIPYVTTTALGAVDVEFKPYGVELEILPSIIREDLIELKLNAKLSAPDETRTVEIAGVTAVGIISRQLTSVVNISPGMIFTIGGLTQRKTTSRKVGIPLLSEIPIIGALFSWQKYSTEEVSIMIFVTPTIIKE